MKIHLYYFAWVREKAGLGEEMVELPSNIKTVSDLMTWQQQRSPDYLDAFANPDAIRVALDQQHTDHDSLIAGATEIAFFPPVTGG